MSSQNIKVILTPASDNELMGNGFYQLEEDKLFVQIGPFSQEHSPFSYLESDNFRFDISKTGQPIFIELTIPRKNWRVDKNFINQNLLKTAGLKFVDFRKIIIEPQITCNHQRTSLRFDFAPNHQKNIGYQLTRNISFELDNESNLMAVTVNNIADDLAGQNLKKFRKEINPDNSSRAL